MKMCIFIVTNSQIRETASAAACCCQPDRSYTHPSSLIHFDQFEVPSSVARTVEDEFRMIKMMCSFSIDDVPLTHHVNPNGISTPPPLTSPIFANCSSEPLKATFPPRISHETTHFQPFTFKNYLLKCSSTDSTHST
jgi:hypothetical protein